MPRVVLTLLLEEEDARTVLDLLEGTPFVHSEVEVPEAIHMEMVRVETHKCVTGSFGKRFGRVRLASELPLGRALIEEAAGSPERMVTMARAEEIARSLNYNPTSVSACASKLKAEGIFERITGLGGRLAAWRLLERDDGNL